MWEVRIYEEKFIYYNQVRITEAEESIGLVTKDNSSKRISREIIRPPVDEILGRVENKTTKERIKEIMEFCESLCGAPPYTTKRHIVYKTSKAFAKIYPQKNQFWVDVRKRGIVDKLNLLKHQHPVFGHIEVPNNLDLYKVKDLIKQSYQSTL